jgi:HTH-type transcriptional regulator / antitoxin HipB
MSPIKDMSFTRDMYIMSSMKDINLRTAEQLGAAVRLKRKEKDLTQSELAKLLGAERKWVINLESGNSKAEIGLVLRALEALNLRASLTDGDKPNMRGGPRDASPLDQVFRNLRQTSRK